MATKLCAVPDCGRPAATRQLARGLSSPTVAAGELQINKRTLYRCLASLRALGLPITRTREGRELHWRTTWAAVEHWLREAPIERPKRAPQRPEEPHD